MTRAADALLDSNVVVAMLAIEHQHHAASKALFTEGRGQRFAIASHSYAEAFSNLTRRNTIAIFRRPGPDVIRALEALATATTLVGLSPPQTFDTIRDYAARGGIGPRLYDRLIGQVAVQYGIPRIVTWNVGHMRDLFPGLDVCDPVAALTPPTRYAPARRSRRIPRGPAPRW